MRKQSNRSSTRLPYPDSATMSPRLSAEQRSALGFAHRCRYEWRHRDDHARPWIYARALAFLARKGLATARWELVKAGGSTIEVGRFRITAAGRRAIEADRAKI